VWRDERHDQRQEDHEDHEGRVSNEEKPVYRGCPFANRMSTSPTKNVIRYLARGLAMP
jgi:hypothetical protein